MSGTRRLSQSSPDVPACQGEWREQGAPPGGRGGRTGRRPGRGHPELLPEHAHGRRRASRHRGPMGCGHDGRHPAGDRPTRRDHGVYAAGSLAELAAVAGLVAAGALPARLRIGAVHPIRHQHHDGGRDQLAVARTAHGYGGRRPHADGRAGRAGPERPVPKADAVSRFTDGSAGDADYAAIGTAYSDYRRPDPRIAARIARALGAARTVLNVGAGAGSYEPADRWVTAVEPSASMRAQRPAGLAPAARGPPRGDPPASMPPRRPAGLAPAVDAPAGALPFADGEFDTAMTTF